MIVGTKDISPSEVYKYCDSVESLIHFSEGLVPRMFRHNRSIVDNQKYCVALIVRDLKSIPYVTRKELYEGLVEGVSITGIGNAVYDIEDLMLAVDVDLLTRFIMEGEE